jgi:hypothetical protein
VGPVSVSSATLDVDGRAVTLDPTGLGVEDPSPIRLSTQPRIVQTHNRRISYQVYGSLAAR